MYRWMKQLFGLILAAIALVLLYAAFKKQIYSSTDSSLQAEILRLQTQLKSVQIYSSQLEEKLKTKEAFQPEKSVRSKDAIQNKDTVEDAPFSRDIPKSRKLPHVKSVNDASFVRFIKNTTVLIYGNDKSGKCVSSQVLDVREKLPNVEILVASKENLVMPGNISQVTVMPTAESTTEGKAFNAMIARVKTAYFLYLSQGAVVSVYKSDNGPGWLFQALELIPELDFIGGSILSTNKTLRYSKIEIQCYRLQMCYWVFAQTFEYKYSIDDMMVCEETSTSFMGRVASLQKVGTFDETLNSMATTDFFWRAKNKAIIGLRPEVFFQVGKTCMADDISDEELSLKRQAFFEKYELERIKDSYGKVIKYPNKPRRPRYTESVWGMPFNYVRHAGFAKPQQYETLRFYLKFFDTFFKRQNIKYWIDGGQALGFIKMRDTLPWDKGDVDCGYYGAKWNETRIKMQAYCDEQKIKCNLGLSGQRGGYKTISAKVGQSHGMREDMYTHEFQETPDDSIFMYINVNGRDYPIKRDIFSDMRKGYGHYLFMSLKQKLVCTRKGHHACVPNAFGYDGGNWKDFYCHL